MPTRCCVGLALLLSACSPWGQPGAHGRVDDPIISLGDARVDLLPFLEGYPYRPLLPLWHEGVLLLDVQSQQRVLHRAPLNSPVPLDQSAVVSPIDWDTRTRWDLRWHAPSRSILLVADEHNDEAVDLYRLGLDDGLLTKLTNEPYLYGYSVSPDDAEVVVLARRGQGPYTTCLSRLTLPDGQPTDVVCDSPQATFTWSEPAWAPDKRGVVTRVNVDGHRARANLAWLAMDGSPPQLLLDPAPARRTVYALSPWLDEHRFAMVSDGSGAPQLGIYDLRTAATEWLTQLAQPITSATLLVHGGQTRAVLTTTSPTGDTLHALDLATRASLGTHSSASSLSPLGSDHERRLLFEATGAGTPTELVDVVLDGAMAVSPRPMAPSAADANLVRCDAQSVSYTTFDAGVDGQPRTLHAYLYTPQNGPPRDKQLVRVKSFYGGDNSFDTETQIFCAAGVSTFSPSVRGSRGFGPAFAALNDGDLGGDEIVDLYEGARWLVGQGFSADRIGVYGRSHGGYATMRALTFPAGFNGHDGARLFSFAFGMGDAGFSDIGYFHDNCNIPDWVVLEAGDPATEADKLAERSPLHHADRLTAPLFMSHGENDSRVPVHGSRAMAKACEAAQKDCTYVEFAGQGHRVHGLANEVKLYRKRFEFLERVRVGIEAK